MRQIQFSKSKSKHRFSHGGNLRNARAGRCERPLSTKEPVHLVLKANREVLRGGFRTPRRFRLAQWLLTKYSNRFFIKIEQVSFQFDHIHIVARLSRRSDFQNFLRVFSGQIAQRFVNEGLVLRVTDTPTRGTKTAARVTGARKDGREQKRQKLWKHRPFTRVVRGWRAFKTAIAYVKLNELEACGLIPYREKRLKGLTAAESDTLLEWRG